MKQQKTRTNRSKRFLRTAAALFMTAVLLTTTVTPLRADDELYIFQLGRDLQEALSEIDRLNDLLENQRTASIWLVSPTNLTLQPGQTTEIEVTLRNVGTQAAQNVFSVAAPSAEAPFTIEFLRNSNNVGRISTNQERTMTLRVSVDADARPGPHSILLDYSFRDEAGRALASYDRISVRIGGVAGAHNVRVENFRPTALSVLPGQTFTVTADVRNAGILAARDVQLRLPNNTGDAGILFTGDLNSGFFANMEPGHSTSLGFTFQAAQNAAIGPHPINFLVTYRGDDGQMQDGGTFTFHVNVTGAPPNLEVRRMSWPSGIVGVGQTGNVSFYLYNTGDVEARNVRVTADPGSHIAPATATRIDIPSLAPGESRQVTFGFIPRQAAETETHTIGFNVSFAVGQAAERTSFEVSAPLNVYNPERDGDGQQIPRVIVSEYSVNPSIPRAGHEFTMDITFRNTNAALSVNNIRVLMNEVLGTAPQGQAAPFAGFAPVGGSDTLFIDFLPPLGEITKTLLFTTNPNATPGTHNLRMTFDYQDQNYVERTATQQLSIAVAQVSRLEIGEIGLEEFGTVGSSVWFSFRVINSGRVGISNIRVRTEGPFDVTEAGGSDGRFIGTIRSQGVFDFSGRFIPLEPGMHRGSFIVEGEDETGTLIEAVHEFNIMVQGGWDEGDEWHEGGGMMQPGIPGRPMPPGMGFEDPSFEEESDGFFAAILGFFTRENPPEGWSDEMGDFRMFGLEPVTSVRWIAVIGVGGGVLLLILVPIIIVIRRKRRRLEFEDDDE